MDTAFKEKLDSFYGRIHKCTSESDKYQIIQKFFSPNLGYAEFKYIYEVSVRLHKCISTLADVGAEFSNETIIKAFYKNAEKELHKKYLGYYAGYNANIPKLSLSILGIAYAVDIIARQKVYGTILLIPSIDNVMDRFFGIIDGLTNNCETTGELYAKLEVDNICLDFDLSKNGFNISRVY